MQTNYWNLFFEEICSEEFNMIIIITLDTFLCELYWQGKWNVRLKWSSLSNQRIKWKGHFTFRFKEKIQERISWMPFPLYPLIWLLYNNITWAMMSIWGEKTFSRSIQHPKFILVVKVIDLSHLGQRHRCSIWRAKNKLPCSPVDEYGPNVSVCSLHFS